MPAVTPLGAKLDSLSGSETDPPYRVNDYKPMGFPGRYNLSW